MVNKRREILNNIKKSNLKIKKDKEANEEIKRNH